MKHEIWIMLDSRSMGGIESHVLLLSKTLMRIGLQLRVVFLRDYGEHPLKRALAKHDIPILEINRNLYRSIREYQPALLHTHGYKAGISGRLMGLCTQTPVVSTYHNGDLGTGKLRVYTWLDRLTGCLSHNITVNSNIAEKLWCNSIVIPNFVEIPPDDAFGGKSNVIAFVGRLSHEKGPDLFCTLCDLLPYFHHHIYGDGPMRKELEGEYGRTVRFFGMVEDMADRWKNIGLLCMTSREEGLPLAALEAMAHKVPVAAFNVGALPELITHDENGFVVFNGDISMLALHIEQYMCSEKSQEFRESAQQVIAAHYTASVCVDEILELYTKVTEGTVC